MMRFAAFLIVWLIALAALSASEHQQPNAGAPLVKSAYSEPPRPHIWRLNSVCTIDEHTNPENVV